MQNKGCEGYFGLGNMTACGKVAETLSTFVEEDSLATVNPMEGVEVSEDSFEGLRLRGLHEREIVLGLGFSLGVHAGVLALAVLMAFFFVPPSVPEASFVTVSLIHSAGSGEGTDGCQAGSGGDSAGMSAQPAASLPSEGSGSEPVKPLQTPHKAVAPKNREKIVSAHKSVNGCPLKAASHQAASSASPVASLSHNQLPSQGDGASLDDGYSNKLGSRGTGGSDAGSLGSGGGSAVGGLRGGLGAAPEELDSKQVDTPPTAIRKVEPEFPLVARRMGIVGKVVVRFLVKTDGSVGKASVIKADPQGVFEQSALEAIDKWRFNPGRYRGAAVATWVVLPVQFRLSR